MTSSAACFEEPAGAFEADWAGTEAQARTKNPRDVSTRGVRGALLGGEPISRDRGRPRRGPRPALEWQEARVEERVGRRRNAGLAAEPDDGAVPGFELGRLSFGDIALER